MGNLEAFYKYIPLSNTRFWVCRDPHCSSGAYQVFFSGLMAIHPAYLVCLGYHVPSFGFSYSKNIGVILKLSLHKFLASFSILFHPLSVLFIQLFFTHDCIQKFHFQPRRLIYSNNVDDEIIYFFNFLKQVLGLQNGIENESFCKSNLIYLNFLKALYLFNQFLSTKILT